MFATFNVYDFQFNKIYHTEIFNYLGVTFVQICHFGAQISLRAYANYSNVFFLSMLSNNIVRIAKNYHLVYAWLTNVFYFSNSTVIPPVKGG